MLLLKRHALLCLGIYIFVHLTMAKQLFSLFALIIFVNTASFIPAKSKCMSNEPSAIRVHKHSTDSAYGRTIMSTIINSVFDIPLPHPKQKGNFFKYFLYIAVIYSVSVLTIRLFRVLKTLICNLLSLNGRHFKTKFFVLPGYYAYLFRLSPF